MSFFKTLGQRKCLIIKLWFSSRILCNLISFSSFFFTKYLSKLEDEANESKLSIGMKIDYESTLSMKKEAISSFLLTMNLIESLILVQDECW